MRFLIYSAGLVLGTALSAETGPAFDCAKAESSAEELICADADLAALDRLVTERYTAALDAATSLDAGSDEAVGTLRATQRGWIKGRDDCWKSEDLRTCVEAAYLQREGELVAMWMLDTPIGTDIWQCDGNPANEVVTIYFNTRLPSVRIERGDTVDAGSLVPAASGSKYVGSFGRSIWIKGDDAIYREQDGASQELNCVRAE